VGDARSGIVDVDTVLPLEFRPHSTELEKIVKDQANKGRGEKEYLCLITIRGFDIVHDINMNIIQNNT